MLIGIGSNGLWEHAYLRLVRQLEDKTGKKGASEPEFRLPPTVFGAVLVPIGLFGMYHIVLVLPQLWIIMMLASADLDLGAQSQGQFDLHVCSSENLTNHICYL